MKSRKYRFHADLTNFDDDEEVEQTLSTPVTTNNNEIKPTLKDRNSTAIKGVNGVQPGRQTRGSRKSLESELKYQRQLSSPREEQIKELKQYQYSYVDLTGRKDAKQEEGEQLRIKRSLYSTSFVQQIGHDNNSVISKDWKPSSPQTQVLQDLNLQLQAIHQTHNDVSSSEDEQNDLSEDFMASQVDKIIQLNPEYDALLKKIMLEKKMRERLKNNSQVYNMTKSQVMNGGDTRAQSPNQELYRSYIQELKVSKVDSPDITTTNLNISHSQLSRNRLNSLKNDLIKRIVQSQDSQDLQVLKNGINHQVEYESHSERNGKRQFRQKQKRGQYSVNVTNKRIINPIVKKLNQTQNNGLTSPSEEEDDIISGENDETRPMVRDIIQGNKSFQSEGSTIIQHPLGTGFTPNYSYKTLHRYPYEYGYNESSRERKIFMARQGSNIFNLGAKLNGSIYRKPPPLGSNIESSFDQQSGEEDEYEDPSRQQLIKLKQKPKVQKNFQTPQHSQLCSDRITAEPDVIQKKILVEEERQQTRHTYLMRQFDKDNFDPVLYLTQNTMMCKKYNYAVPASYGFSDAIIRYNNEKETIDIFNVEHLINKSTKDDGDIVMRNGRTLHKLDKLRYSLKIKEISGFIYGPFSTRFWMMRMGLNQLIADNIQKSQGKNKKNNQKEKANNDKSSNDSEDYDNSQLNNIDWEKSMPFFAWDCISIQLEDRDISLVIQDEVHMKILILFLIVKLNTYNGIRNSIHQLRKHKIIKRNIPIQHMMQSIYFTFFMMKIRMKISFEACRQQKTIKELLLLSILKTYHDRRKRGLIRNPYPEITKSMIQGIKRLGLKNYTSKTMQEEARQLEKDRLLKGGQGIQSLDMEDQIKEEKQLQTQTAMFKVLSKSILAKDGIDDLFEKHYESDDGLERKKLVEFYVQEVKDDHHHGDGDHNHDHPDHGHSHSHDKGHGHSHDQDNGHCKASHVGATGFVHAHVMQREVKETQEDIELRKFLTQRNKFLFKKKISKTEKKQLYNKIMLLIKLRVLKGPLFIFAQVESLKLSKKILTLDLEMGREVVIPQELNIKEMPNAFQYYDCIIEIMSRKLSADQKVLIMKHDKHKKIQRKKINDFKSLFKINQDEDKKAIDVEASLGERIGRFFKDLFSRDELRNEKSVQDEEYASYLQLYKKAQNIQAARYIEVNKKWLRRVSQQKKIRSQSRRGRHQSKPLIEFKEQTGLRFLSSSRYEEISKYEDKHDNLLEDENLLPDLNYITHKQVGRKRKKVFATKILYQNQLTSLKEKGKRLLVCEMVDREARKQTKEYFGTVADNGQRALLESQISHADQKQFMDGKKQIESAFGKNAIIHQEQNVHQMRVQLIKNLLAQKTFNARNQFIDNKIQFDQRFFQDGYAEFQLLISDIRKQIRLNEEVLRLKNQLQKIYDQIQKDSATLMLDKGLLQAEQNQQSIDKSTFKKQTAQLRDKMMQHQQMRSTLDQKKLELIEQKILDEQHARQIQEEWKAKTAAKESNHKLIIRSLQRRDGLDRVSEEEEDVPLDKIDRGGGATIRSLSLESSRQPTPRSPISPSSPVSLASCSSPVQSQSSKHHKRGVRGLIGTENSSTLYSGYPTLISDGGVDKNVETRKIVQNESINQSKLKSENVIMQRLKQAAINSSSSENQNHLFAKLASVVPVDHPRRVEIEQIQEKIQRRRNRIKQVSHCSQKSLWGKDGGYQPNQAHLHQESHPNSKNCSQVQRH